MRAHTLHAGAAMSVIDFRCTARPGDPAFVEHHHAHSLSYVHSGSFGLRARGRAYDLVAGSVMVGHPGDEYLCSHDHVCGDHCLSFQLGPATVEATGDHAAAWRLGSLPPLPEL
ncbi:MAG: AraC family transcriptional regulator, partial [Myxococcales bacterium]|nr:AraC family transcriptional regulator [Myxococcales bacterium]